MYLEIRREARRFSAITARRERITFTRNQANPKSEERRPSPNLLSSYCNVVSEMTARSSRFNHSELVFFIGTGTGLGKIPNPIAMSTSMSIIRFIVFHSLHLYIWLKPAKVPRNQLFSILKTRGRKSAISLARIPKVPLAFCARSPAQP